LTANLVVERWLPPSIIATRRLRPRFTSESQSPHLADLSGVWRMRFKVEIEARLANSELWIPSTLVFLRFSRTRFRVVFAYSLFKDRRWSLRPPTYLLLRSNYVDARP